MKNLLCVSLLALSLTACSLSAAIETDKNTYAFATGQAKIERALENASITDIEAKLVSGEWTSEKVVKAYLGRIENINPQINAVMTLNPNAIAEAKALDAERKAGKIRGPLHGVPILIKDNIETMDAMATTAGALALKDNFAGRDAPMIARLRAEGAIILGKTNLSQWANFRSSDSISGWSAMGGQTRNPHALDRNPCGSSSGSGAAMAASLAAATIGTETNGSIICPSNANGVVGFKPTVGQVSRTHIIPISPTQDTAGPMVKTVRDAALMMDAMAGKDEADPATLNYDIYPVKFTSMLTEDALTGKRVGVLRFAQGEDARISALFDDALHVLESQGAILVDIEEWDGYDGLWADEFLVLQVEFKASLNEYLASTIPAVTTRTLADVIAFNTQNAAIELPLFGQDILETSEALGGLDDPKYKEAVERMLAATRQDGIEKLLADNDVDMLVAPSGAPAFLIEPVFGDQYSGGVGAGWMAAMAGTPHLTVPMGSVQGLPVGLSFMGAAWDDANVLNAGYAYEQASHKLIAPEFYPTTGDVPVINKAQQGYGK